MKNKPLVITIIIIILGIGFYYIVNRNYSVNQNMYVPTDSQLTPPVPSPQIPSNKLTAGPGEHCGGNMSTALMCDAGYYCAPTPGSHLPFGDVGGICLSNVPNTVPGNIVKTVGEKEGSFLIQKINSTSVGGLWYQAYPVSTTNGTPKTLHIGDDIGYACEGVSEKLVNIDFAGQEITFNKVTSQPPVGGCPI